MNRPILTACILAAAPTLFAREVDSARALRKLAECVNPKPKAACQYYYVNLCYEAIKSGLSAANGAEARYVMAQRALAMADSRVLCALCDDWVERANCEVSGIQEDSAVLSLKEALRLKPDHAEARSSLVHFYARKKNLAQAYQLAMAGVSLRPDQPDAHALLGYACLELERWPEALESYRQAVRLDPGNYADRLADVAGSFGLFDEALKAYTRALEFKPGSTSIHARLAVLYERHGKRAEAEREFRTVLSREPAFFENAYNSKQYGPIYERIPSQARRRRINLHSHSLKWLQDLGSSSLLLAMS